MSQLPVAPSLIQIEGNPRLRRRRRFMVMMVWGVTFCFWISSVILTLYSWNNLFILERCGIEVELRGPALVVRAITPGSSASRAKVPLQNGDQLTGLKTADGRLLPFTSRTAYVQAKMTVDSRQPVHLVVQRMVKNTLSSAETITLQPRDSGTTQFPLTRAFVYGIPLMAFLTALIIGFQKPEDHRALVMFFFFVSFSTLSSMQNVVLLPGGIREIALLWFAILNSGVIFLFMLVFLLFPSPSFIEERFPRLKHIFFFANLPLTVLTMVEILAVSHSFKVSAAITKEVGWLDQVFSVFFIVMLVIGLTSLLMNTLRAKTKDERRRLVIILSSAGIAVLPATCVSLFLYFYPATPVSPWVVFAILLGILQFPPAVVYVVLKHRVMGIRFLVRRGLRYALVSKGFLLVEGLLLFWVIYFALSPTLERVVPSGKHGVLAGFEAMVILGAMLCVRNLNRWIMPRIDRRFFREDYKAEQMLMDVGQLVRTHTGETGKLLQSVVSIISDALYPDHTAVFLRVQSSFDRLDTEEPLRIDPREKRPFQCVHHRIRQGHQDAVPSAQSFQEIAIPEDAYVVAEMKRIIAEHEQSLEIYPEDPESFLNYLLTQQALTGVKQQEMAFLELFNPRVILPLVVNQQIVGFISLGEKLSEEPYSHDNRKMLGALVQQTAMAIENNQMFFELAEQQKLKREIEIAQEVQRGLFPQTFPEMQTLDYSGSCKTARGVGGDYYDFIRIEPGLLGLALADVAGKGISAALLMANLQALLRSQAGWRRCDVDLLTRDISRHLFATTGLNRYATFFYGVYDDQQRRLTFVNAGHNPPYLYRKSQAGDSRHKAIAQSCQSGGGERAIMEGGVSTAVSIHEPDGSGPNMTTLDVGGIPVGMMNEFDYEKGVVQLRPGDILVLFSDGLMEAWGSEGEDYPESRIRSIVSHCWDKTADFIRKSIIDDVYEFMGKGLEPTDDMTLVVAKVS